MSAKTEEKNDISFEDFQAAVSNDYRIVCESRETSLMGRRSVKWKRRLNFEMEGTSTNCYGSKFSKRRLPFGILPRSSFMMAKGLMSVQQFFAALYGHADVSAEPQSGGRQMVAHFLPSR